MQDLSRRSVLKMAGGLTLSLGFPGKILAVLADGSIVVQDHRVPLEKHLNDKWRKSLFARGTKEVWRGKDLDSIGMPIGGIATGQLYLCGDGTLGCWEIFNKHSFQNSGPAYGFREIPKPVDFGFSLVVGEKKWRLNKKDFPSTVFRGEHPIGTIQYGGDDCPLQVEMTAFSPFIPLNAADSALPATCFEITLRNLGAKPVTFTLEGLLENACAPSDGMAVSSRKKRISISAKKGWTMLEYSADPAKGPNFPAVQQARGNLPIANFDGPDYAGWKVEGTAFGTAPAKATLPGQQQVTGFEGAGLVNSFLHGDDAVGRLISPPFRIERTLINFKIGGGDKPGKACVNLLVDGKVVRTATGRNEERLLWETWDVSDFEGKQAQIEIVDEATGGWGHINIDEIEQADVLRSAEDYQIRHGDPNLSVGTMALACLAVGGIVRPKETPIDAKQVGILYTNPITVQPGKSRTVRWILAWHFPNHPRGRNYANKFADASAVALYISGEYKRLSQQTRLWKDTYYDSTLPYWLLDRVHSTLGNLATGTTEWWKSGRFWAWEGVVCCAGTCTHVWNYEHGLARLFPEIERNIRVQQDFGEGFDRRTGLVGFRSDREYAADGQCGTVLKAYREHLTSKDAAFLTAQWPNIRKALEYLIEHDANGDGVIEDSQPNTYDIDFFGANTFVGALYLAALRAGEEMAKTMKDAAFAQRCRSLFEKGREVTTKRLWNGEYFQQEVDAKQHPDWQYGPGCLSDQLFGQGWAHQVGLGHLYPAEHVKTALKSIYKYNWAPDVAAQNKRWAPERPFAVPGEGGLFICTWPHGGREKQPVRYRDEVWTGIEYQVASHMIWEGLVEEGLALCRAVHERYHPAKRNPYNEVECSDHYARAMASWGVITALSGFEYDGPAGRIAFDPKMTPDHFRSLFTSAEGWGTYEQRQGKSFSASIKLRFGNMRFSEITLNPGHKSTVQVRRGQKRIAADAVWKGSRVTVRFAEELRLLAGDALHLDLVGME